MGSLAKFAGRRDKKSTNAGSTHVSLGTGFEFLEARLAMTAGITAIGEVERIGSGVAGSVDLRDDGKYIVTWRDSGVGDVNVHLQQRTIGGTAAEAIQLNTTGGFHSSPHVDHRPDGSAMVAWSSPNTVAARRLTAEGTPTGEAATHATASISKVVVSSFGDEQAVTWRTYGDTWRYQRYGADGIPVFESPVQWGQGIANERFDAELERNGSMVMLAQNLGDGPRMRLLRYDANGQAIGAPIGLESTTGDESMPAIEVAEDGSILAGWTASTSSFDPQSGPSTAHHPLELQRFSSAGVSVGDRIIVGSAVELFDMDMMDDGSFIITWKEDAHLYANVYNKFGRAALQTPLVVSNEIGDYMPVVSANEQGQAVIAWTLANGDINGGMYEIEPPADIAFGGTSRGDVVSLQLGATQHWLSINGGAPNRYDASQIKTFEFLGGNGTDTLVIRGTDAHDIAYADGALVTFEHEQRNYKVRGVGFEQVTFDGGGGPDRASMYGSSDAQKHDKLTGMPQWSLLQAGYTTAPNQADFSYEAQNFSRVDAFARGGAAELASVYGTAGNDQFFRFAEYEVLVGENMIQKTHGFSRVDAFGRGGNDSTYLTDSSGDDSFFSFPQFAVLVLGNEQDRVMVKGFENVRAVANQGGTDKAYLRKIRTTDLLFAAAASTLLVRSGQQETLFGYDAFSAEPDNGQRPGKSVEENLTGLTTTGNWYDI